MTTRRTLLSLTLCCLALALWARPAPAAPAAPAAEENYLLGPEDVLEISVWKDTELTKEVTVQLDGCFSFPLAGQVLAKGRSVTDVQQELTKKLANFVSSPVVTVLLKKVQSYHVYVIGKVNRPGEFMLGRRIDVMQALAMAGGTTPFASAGDISILREGGPAKNRLRFDYGEVARGKHLEQNIELHSGDVVVVP